MKNNNNDDYFKRLSAMEQAAAAMRPVAGIITGYFNALVDNGLSREEALSLTKDYQNLFWTMSFQNQLIETLRKQVDKEDRNEGF
jgi:hypothetical protein